MRLLRTPQTALLAPAMMLVAALASPLGPPLTPPLGPAVPERWHPPLGHPLKISAGYSLPDGPYRAGHRGIDLPATTGAEVLAPANGTVSFAGTVVDRPVISIRIDERTILSMEPVTSELHEGDPVARGEPIGEVSSGGHCVDTCLHLGLRIDGEYANPMRFLRPRPVLLPW